MTVSGSGASADYLLSDVGGGRENYYTTATSSGEPAGRWSGKLAARLGLEGEVDASAMYDLYSQYVAPDGTALGRAPKSYTVSVERDVAAWVGAHPGALPEEVERARQAIERGAPGAVQGWDLTSSVSKSISAAHAAVWRQEAQAERAGDEATRLLARSTRLGIERVLERANAAMLERVDSLTYTRAGAHGRAGTAGRWVRTDELAVATFMHHTSRALDPQLHWHNAILNKARDVEGEYRALDTADLQAHVHELGAVFDREAAEGLAALGISMVMRDTGAQRPSWEVAAVDQATSDLFSTRRKAILRDLGPKLAAAEAKLGRELSDVELKRLRQEITLASRPGKSHVAESFETMLDRWHDRLVRDAATGLDPLGEEIIRQVQAGPSHAASPMWSERDVTERAIAALGERRPTWRRADLYAEIEQRVPLVGSRLTSAERGELFNRLTDRALAEAGQVAQVAGFEGVPVPAELGGRLRYAPPSRVRYATRGTLAGEEAIRQAAGVRGRHHVPAAAARAWLAKNRPSIGQDQREAGVGLVTSDAAVCRLIGPPGAGKSYTVATVRDMWRDLSGGGRVLGVTVAQVAADVLASEGVDVSANVAKFLQVQDRIAAGKGREEDMRYVLDRRDLVVLDEASMVDREQVRRVHEVVERAGGRLILAGDPAQLGSIGAGGVLPLLDGYADTFTLSDIRRMTAGWERRASVMLRARDQAAIGEYDRHGRIVDCATTAEAEEAAAKAYVAETLAGKSVVVTATTEAQAASISAATRARLVAKGLVDEEGVPLASGILAGVGDVVMCRENSRALGLTNRCLYRVESVEESGALRAVNLTTGEPVVMPAPYVESKVDAGYAGTVHATEGLSVDAGYTVTDGGMDARSLLVALTRGREVNKVFVALGREGQQAGETPARAADVLRDEDGKATRERAVELGKDRRQETGRAVLSRVLAKGDELDAAALVMAERDAAYLASASTVLGRYEDVTREGCRQRLEGDLDRLVAEGDLDESVRARMNGEEETESLSRIMRAVEQNGEDPYQVLREASQASFAKANNVASVLAGRVKAGRDLTAGAAVQGDEVPARLPAGYEAYLVALQGVRDDRRAELGTEAAVEPPAWAVQSLGPVPDEPLARLGWERRAGEVAWYREAVNHTDEARALPSGPGISETEHRGAWCGAYTALGRPEGERSVAAMTDGQLRVRIEAWRRQEELAPAFANAAMKAQNLAAEEARHAAAEAGEAEAAVWLAEHEARRAMAESAELVGEVRDSWYAETAAQREGAEAAKAELVDVRGRQEGEACDDLMTAEDWLAAARAADVAEDPHRVVSDVEVVDEERQVVVEAKLDEAVEAGAGVNEPVVVPAQAGAGEASLPAQPSAAEVEAAAHRAVLVSEMLADRASAEQAQAQTEDAVYEVDLAREEVAHVEDDGPVLVAER